MAGRFRKGLCAVAKLGSRVPGFSRLGRECARSLAGRYKERRFLGGLPGGPWISPRAEWAFRGRFRAGHGVFIDDRCTVYCRPDDGFLELGARTSLWRDSLVHCEAGGGLVVGEDTHIQNACIFTAVLGAIRIGSAVQIAPRCSFYPYDHGFDDPDLPLREQPLTTKGGIVIEDDVWLGVGVTVLDGVTIGRGAVIGAGAVVSRSIPPGTIAVGQPARVVRYRPGYADPAGQPLSGPESS